MTAPTGARKRTAPSLCDQVASKATPSSANTNSVATPSVKIDHHRRSRLAALGGLPRNARARDLAEMRNRKQAVDALADPDRG